ncbi:hypothetical protein BDZ88DRAFT_492168 [Geranomyces variabilis]|nr:hypothetical protein BDZ88DRAFT_492168 [Geranomyces variabilis]KAJ3131214.1 hypothetical protein HDU90_008667 [Geranomyces variabilis]
MAEHIDPPFCRWHIRVHDCNNERYFIMIMWASAFFAAIMTVCGIGTLAMRARKSEHCFFNAGLASFEMFMLWASVGTGCPMTLWFVVMATDWQPLSTNPILMAAWECFPWTVGRSSLWIYTFAMLLSTPNSTTKRRPPTKTLSLILRALIIAELCLTTPFAAWSGQRLLQGDIYMYQVLTGVVNALHSVQSASLGIGMWFFGGQMVEIATENRNEMKASLRTSKSSHNLDEKLGRAILKMQMMNLSAMSSLGWQALILLIFAFMPEKVLSRVQREKHLQDFAEDVFSFQLQSVQWWSLIQCAMGFVGVTSFFACAQVVVLWAEFHPKEVPEDMVGILNVMIRRQSVSSPETQTGESNELLPHVWETLRAHCPNLSARRFNADPARCQTVQTKSIPFAGFV